MRRISLTEAKAKLGELVVSAAAGETVEITKRGKPVAQLVAPSPERKPIRAADLRAVTEKMTMQTESAGDFMRRLRDDARY
jgi:prevent-host-death family protein